MKKPSKRQAGISMLSDYRPKSKISLEGDHAETAVNHPIGRRVKFVVHATKQSHSKNMDGKHSASYDVDKIEKIDNEKTDKHAIGKAEEPKNDR